ncbi:MAG TPA: carbamoyltransferase C-terminal domain-containing protein [Ktedonobacteraceae bacterium]|nr:carbamoyltransferase C-terminal domain-containing protein [Ktedonobacteraceae bacterium]
MYILGLSAYMHDTSACLLQDGRIVAAVEEERFTRQRHAWRQMPHHASRYCLDAAGIELDEVDYVVTAWNAQPRGESVQALTSQEALLRQAKELHRLFPPNIFPCKAFPTFACVNHHLAHASSAFRCSGMDEATILVIDGRGEHTATSVFWGKGNTIRLIREFDIPDSLGFFYLAVTRFIGFGGWGEGKTMGYAPYGVPRYDFEYLQPTNDGYRVIWERALPRSDQESSRGDCTLDIMAAWMNRLEQQFGEPNLSRAMLDLNTAHLREPFHDTQIYRDIAASAQKKLEEIILHLAQRAIAETGCRNLVLAGGVALNCVTNGLLVTSNTVDQIFIQPAAQDAGTSMGAALELYAQLGYKSQQQLHHTSFGPAYSNQTIQEMLEQTGLPYTECTDPASTAATLLAENRVVGWFQGALEWGPRALGNRSIFANPAQEGVRDYLNNHVKHREHFRPYALALPLEKADTLFQRWCPSPFMLLNFEVKREYQAKVQEGIHRDGTTRPQTVDREQNPLYWKMLHLFTQFTGLPGVINTSLNDHGAPLVCTPYDALRTFYSTALENLLIGNFLLQKKHVKGRF